MTYPQQSFCKCDNLKCIYACHLFFLVPINDKKLIHFRQCHLRLHMFVCVLNQKSMYKVIFLILIIAIINQIWVALQVFKLKRTSKHSTLSAINNMYIVHKHYSLKFDLSCDLGIYVKYWELTKKKVDPMGNL